MLLLPNDFPKIKERTNSTRKIKNKIFAIPAAPEATPPNPNTAAIMAIMRKLTVQSSIIVDLKFKKKF